MCTNLLPGLTIRNITNSSKNTLDGAKYFNSFPVYKEKSEIITWNKSVLQPRDYQRLFCPGRCQEDRFVILDGYGTCSTIKCFPCDCDKPKCQIYGTCCPDIEDNSNGVVGYRRRAQNTSHSTATNCSNASQEFVQTNKVLETLQIGEKVSLYCNRYNDDTSYLTIRSCPNYYPNNSFSLWEYSVVCQHYQKVYMAKNDVEFLRLSLRNDSSCYLKQIPPLGYNHYMCEPGWFNPIVSKCNVTGKWATYDNDIVTSCAEPDTLLGHACFTGLLTTVCYKNVFCAICNMHDYPEWLNACGRNQVLANPFYLLPLSLLFNFGHRKLQRNSPVLLQHNTSDFEWKSLDGRILSLECSPGKNLFNGNCSSVIEAVSGLAYNISILYVPKSSQILAVNGSEIFSLKSANDVDYWRPFSAQLMEKVNKIFLEQQDYMELSSRTIFPQTSDQLWNESLKQTNHGTIRKLHTSVWYHLRGFIIASGGTRRDEFENNIMRQLIKEELFVESDVNMSLRFKAVIIKENQKHLLGDYYIKKNNLTYLDTKLESKRIVNRKFDINQLKSYCLTISPELSCPFVTFTKSDYITYVRNDQFPPAMTITLKLKRSEMIFKEADELNFVSFTDAGDLRVCHHLLKHKLSHLTSVRVSDSTTFFRVLEILTITCISVSMLSLVLTFLTYVLLSELRNSAGHNIICLCISLFLAQASLIVASQIEKTGFFCTVSGISIHYFWLNVFCWCFTCSYNMFCVFSAKTRTTRSSSWYKKEMAMKLFFCSAAPALVVSLVIHCSLDSPLLVYITLFTPILGILISNFVFYLISVIEIHNVRKLQTQKFLSKHESSKSIYIYLKLSTVTGIFWILTLIAEATDIDALRVFAILLNGLQGVFIFVSFVCNKRVLKMYKDQIELNRNSRLAASTINISSETNFEVGVHLP
ncbi:unnamed protein product [Candidula unifasciata]|uniref:G-protein coupled receptors family 2 profile 2 domain-containing protein n=1 Tax=Candidula unifasciata TaxID=100452 RepID=A0A8S4A9V8_9EUPU|nr:unnamed protein product [Candidula unifasciata]